MVVLCAYVRAACLEALAAGELHEAGYITDDGKKWAALLKDSQRAVSTFGRALKLTPASRSPQQTSLPAPSPLSYYARMQASDDELDRDEQPAN